MGAGMLWLVLLLGGLAAVAYGLRRWRRGPLGQGPGELRWVGGLQLGPQHRVVVIEVGPAGQRQQLVLGLATGSVTSLHSQPLCEPEGLSP